MPSRKSSLRVARGDEIIGFASRDRRRCGDPADGFPWWRGSSTAHWRRSSAPVRAPRRRARPVRSSRVTRPSATASAAVDQPPGEQQILGPRRPDEIDQPRRSSPPTGSCRACARSARRTAPPACRRADRTPARSRSRRRRRRPAPARSSAGHALEPIDDGVEPPLVGDAVLAGCERVNWRCRCRRRTASPAPRSTSTRSARRRRRGRTPRRARRTSPRSWRCGPRAG